MDYAKCNIKGHINTTQTYILHLHIDTGIGTYIAKTIFIS